MTTNRSNLCKILNVNYDEVFDFNEKEYKITIDPYGEVLYFLTDTYNPERVPNCLTLVNMINHPEKIIRHNVPAS